MTALTGPKNIEIISQLIDDEYGHYRVRKNRRIHHLKISTDTFDEDTMCRPYLLIPELPYLPEFEWTRMTILERHGDTLIARISTDPLPEIRTAWHEQDIDELDLQGNKLLSAKAYETSWHGRPAIAKIAAFDWDVAHMEREIWAYNWITHDAMQHPDEPALAPKLLGHLTENGRVVGILLEKVDGEMAGIEDLAGCTELLSRLHRIGLVHGDPNRHNFIVDRSKGRATMRLIDFEHVTEYEEEAARSELRSLTAELTEHTGRGTVTVRIRKEQGNQCERSESAVTFGAGCE